MKIWRTFKGEHLPRPHLYVLLLTNVAVLNVIGLVMVLSASSISSLSTYGNAWFYFQRQLVWVLLGFGAFVVVARLDYRKWRFWVSPLLGIAAILLLFVVVPGLGIQVSGARRWLGVGNWRFQPSEIAKFALLVFTADLVARRAHQLADPKRVLRPVLLVLAGLSVLTILEPDMDSVIVFALIVGGILVAGGVAWRQLGAVMAVAAGLAVLFGMAVPYRRVRIFAYLNPWGDASNTGYQISQSLIAFGSGGYTGVGLGAGRSKWLFLPNAHTDFIYSIIAEELGLVGSLLVLGLFVTFAILGVQIAQQASDRFGGLLAIGVTAWVVGQAIINLGAVIGLIPVSGIPLPFVSFGGSALVFTMAAAGVLASVARYSRVRVRVE